jgi:lysophospholipase L1-like esterase
VVVPWSPDVVIVAYGIIELQPNIVPTRVVRHMTTASVAGTGPVGLWNRRLKRRVWPRLRDLQRRGAAVAGTRTWRVKPAHFAAELDRFVRVAREQRSLVLVCDVGRPGSRLEHFFPGIGERHRIYEEAIEGVVERASDDDVRLVRISAVIDERGEEAMPDGMHFDAKAHATIAALLAAEAQPWLAKLR